MAPAAAAADAALLGRVGYFRSLPPSRLAALAARCRTRTLAAGATLFDEGAPCAGLFIVATVPQPPARPTTPGHYGEGKPKRGRTRVTGS